MLQRVHEGLQLDIAALEGVGEAAFCALYKDVAAHVHLPFLDVLDDKLQLRLEPRFDEIDDVGVAVVEVCDGPGDTFTGKRSVALLDFFDGALNAADVVVVAAVLPPPVHHGVDAGRRQVLLVRGLGSGEDELAGPEEAEVADLDGDEVPGLPEDGQLLLGRDSSVPESVQVSDRKGELEILPVSLGDDWRLSRLPEWKTTIEEGESEPLHGCLLHPGDGTQGPVLVVVIV